MYTIYKDCKFLKNHQHLLSCNKIKYVIGFYYVKTTKLNWMKQTSPYPNMDSKFNVDSLYYDNNKNRQNNSGGNKFLIFIYSYTNNIMIMNKIVRTN